MNHLRGSSAGSVADILEKHKGEVDVVAKGVGVGVIVSKFDLTYRGRGVDTVDVGLPLAQVFKPRGQVLNWVIDIGKQEPFPVLDVLAIPPEE